MQNTRPASCLNGQKQNIDRTGCKGKTLAILLINLLFLFTLHLSAIPSPINIIEIQYTHNATYTRSEEHQTYAVQAWTEFGIECNSVASADINVYIGKVTWYKKTTSTSGGASTLIRIHDKAYCKCVCLFIDYTFAIPLLGEDELVPVEVIHILQDNNISSGSGETDMLMESPLTSMYINWSRYADFTIYHSLEFLW